MKRARRGKLKINIYRRERKKEESREKIIEEFEVSALEMLYASKCTIFNAH